MAAKQEVQAQIAESGVVAVLRGVDAEQIVPVARAIHAAGVTAIEITASDPNVSEKVVAVTEALADTDAVVGAGTVLDRATAQSVIDAGAKFVLAPDVNESVVTTCNRYGVLCAPGVMTPTEATTAIEAGADILKLFPAATVGSDHISALQGPLGDVPILPTGGIGPENVDTFFEGGAIAVGIGSSIVDDDAIASGDMDQVRETASTVVTAVDRARN